MSDRRRNIFTLLLVLGLVIASLAVILLMPTKLGLELKGGVQLVYLAKPTAQAKVDNESLTQAITIMDKRVDQIGVTQPEIQRSGGQEIDVALPDVSNAARAEAEVGKTAQLYFYDWEPNVIGPNGKPAGASEPTATGGPNAASSSYGLPEYEAVLRAAKRPPIIRKTDTTLAPGCTAKQEGGCVYGSWYLLDTKHEKVLRGPEETEANLYADGYKPPVGSKTKVVHVNPGTVLVQSRPVETASGKVTQQSPNSWYVLNDEPVLEGKDITNPVQGFDENGDGQPNVSFGFTSYGKGVFERVTKEIAHRGQEAQLPGVRKEDAEQHFAVVLDEQVITAPSIDYTQYPEGIDSTTGSQISGGFTITSAQNLANELQSGALPIKLELISNSQVSATLGKTALKQGLLAMLAGFLVVCVFLLTFYRVLGAIAVGGLLICGIYLFALVKLIPVTLTLPGIAGVVLTIGVAADANIVIYERVKEEIRGGRSIVSGIATGYSRGFAAIVDANVVTFMTAFILFALATAEVKGFAFMLGIGVLVSLFTAVLATRAALGLMGRSRLVSHPSALGASKPKRQWTMDFMGRSKWFFSLSGTILLIGALAIGGKGINFGIDFKSGTRIQTAFTRPVSQAEVSSVLTAKGYPNAQVQKFSSKGVGGSGYQISTKKLQPAQVSKVKAALDEKFGNGPLTPGDQELLEHLDRPDLRQDDRGRRDHRDHRLAAGDLDIYRAALRVEVRRAGADRADARPADHGRDLLADRPRSDLGHRRRAAHDPRVLAVRHDHRVRQGARERPANAQGCVLADRQPFDVRGADAVAGDELLHAAAGARAVPVRRQHAQGLRVRVDSRDRLRGIFLDLHRVAGADPLEGARARLSQPPRAHHPRTGRRAGLRDGRRWRADRCRARAQAQAHAPGQPDRARRSRVSRSPETSSRNWCRTSTSTATSSPPRAAVVRP